MMIIINLKLIDDAKRYFMNKLPDNDNVTSLHTNIPLTSIKTPNTQLSIYTETLTQDTDNSIVCPHVYTETSSPSGASERHSCTIPFYTHR